MVSFKSPSFSSITMLTRLLSPNLRCNKIVLTTCLLFQVIVVVITPTLGQLQQGANSDNAAQILAQPSQQQQHHHHNHQIFPSQTHHLSNQQNQQQHHLLSYQQIDQENNPQGSLLEQQLIALANAAKLTNAGINYNHNQGHSTQINPISSLSPSSSASQNSSNQSQVNSASSSGSSESSAASTGSSSSRSRSPRSIGEMFKKFFNGNKRSKQSQQSNREWEQQQQQLQQQQLQHQSQQSQAANMAAMAAAAANQHAVYASPFATYSPAVAAQSQAALYPQFSPYSSPGLVAWPTSPNLAQALRATPTLIGPPSPAVTLAGSTPLYAAASQSYNSYAVPPPSTQSAPSGPSPSSAGNPVAAASHAHPSAVPAPAGMSSGSGNSLDFHQVLDAFVRTSGFAPAGDGAEAAAASGYGSKSDGTPVFSFKKLISMPFYLSTEEKPLDGLANAVGHGGSGGYSLHSMPIMRRHVRRMSTPASQQQQQQQYNNNLAAAIFGDNQQLTNNQLQRSERAQVQQYNNYINAINNQLASMTANNQIMQYLNQQQSTPSIASQMDAYSAEAALANYQALANLNAASNQQQQQQQQQVSVSPYKSSGINNRNSVVSNASPANGNLALAASMMSPSAVQPPQGLGQQQQQQQQQAELQAVLNSMQQMSAIDPTTGGSQFQSLNDGHRFGSQQQHQWSNNRHFQSDIIPANSYNSGANLQQQAAVSAGSDYLNLPQQQATGMFNAQNNVMDHQQLNHLAQQQQQQQPQHHHHHHHQISANGALIGNSNQQQSLGGNQQSPQQVENSQITANIRQQSNLNTQQSQPHQLASSLIGASSGQQQPQDPSSTSGLSLSSNSNNNNNSNTNSGSNNNNNSNNPNNGDASSNLNPVSQLDDQQNK